MRFYNEPIAEIVTLNIDENININEGEVTPGLSQGVQGDES